MRVETLKQQTNPREDIFDLLEGGEHLDLDPVCRRFPVNYGIERLRGVLYDISGFDIVQGLDLLFG